LLAALLLLDLQQLLFLLLSFLLLFLLLLKGTRALRAEQNHARSQLPVVQAHHKRKQLQSRGWRKESWRDVGPFSADTLELEPVYLFPYKAFITHIHIR
jgi:hypothetical protein